MKTLPELLAEAEALLTAGKLDEFDAAMKTYNAAKILEDAKIAATPAVKSNPKGAIRLPFAASDATLDDGAPADGAKAAQDWAAKRWYVKKYGELDPALTQIVHELYPNVRDVNDYYRLNAAKSADLNRYLRRGAFDPALSSTVVLTQDQIAEAIMFGNSVSEIKSTMIEAQDTLGGYLVPEDFHLEVVSRLPGLTVMRPLATVVQTTRDLYTTLRRTGGSSRYTGAVRVVKVDETPSAASVSESNATFGKVQIPIHTIMANVPLSRSLLEDSALNLGALLQEEFSQALAIFEDEQYLVGNGIGGPSGILKDNTTGGPYDGVTGVSTVNSGHASLLNNADTVVSVPLKLDAQYRQSGAVWIMAKATREVIASLQDGQGRYLLGNNLNPLAGNEGEALRGYAIKESEAMPSIAANQYPVAYGDCRGYRIVDRIGMSVERYLDSNTAATDTVIYYVRRRGGGQPVNPERFVVVKISA